MDTVKIRHPARKTLTADAAPEKMLQDIDALLKAGDRCLKFPGRLEWAFQEEISSSRIPHFLMVSLIGIFVYNSFIVADYYLIPDIINRVIFLQIFVVTPIIVISIFLIKSRFIPPEVGATTCLVIIFLTIMYFYFESSSEHAYLLIFAVPTCLIFGNVVLPLPFVTSVVFTSFCLVVSTAAILLRPGWDTTVGVFFILVNASSGIYMLFSTHRTEVSERRAYLFNLREEIRSDILASSLANQQAMVQSLMDTGPDAIILFDRRGTILSFSPAAETLFGWPAAEVLGRNIGALMPESTPPGETDDVDDYLADMGPLVLGSSREVSGLRRDGSIFPMMLHVGKVQIGDKLKFTGILHDLSALRQAHDQSQDLRTQLAHVWSMNSLGEMAAVLAHELNQPLSAIANYVHAARTIVASGDIREDSLLEALDRTGGQALRAGEIIKRMRSLIARNPVEPKLECLSDIITEIDFMTRLAAKQEGASVRYDLSEAPFLVLVDRIQIQQVISNLVRNGAEALHGCPDRILEISTRCDGLVWTVSVDDSGPGVAPAMMEQLFVPLATSKPQGMGLGLTVSRAIIVHHKGEMSVARSKLGGASFRFTLPAVQKNKVIEPWTM